MCGGKRVSCQKKKNAQKRKERCENKRPRENASKGRFSVLFLKTNRLEESRIKDESQKDHSLLGKGGCRKDSQLSKLSGGSASTYGEDYFGKSPINGGVIEGVLNPKGTKSF